MASETNNSSSTAAPPGPAENYDADKVELIIAKCNQLLARVDDPGQGQGSTSSAIITGGAMAMASTSADAMAETDKDTPAMGDQNANDDGLQRAAVNDEKVNHAIIDVDATVVNMTDLTNGDVSIQMENSLENPVRPVPIVAVGPETDDDKVNILDITENKEKTPASARMQLIKSGVGKNCAQLGSCFTKNNCKAGAIVAAFLICFLWLWHISNQISSLKDERT